MSDNQMSVRDVERDIMNRPSERNTTNLDLKRMRMILDLLGNPQDSFRIIHITGTNGKGSTARMAEAICRAYGMRTGLYTSPPLEHVSERIVIDGRRLSDDDFVELWNQVKDFVALVDKKMDEEGAPRMSFFEVLTAMAIWKFADAPVDVAIVEVGMGGRWDATNVLDADAAVIGPIDMDHMAWLGDTVEQIAQEKVGIIKPGCTAIIGRQPHESADAAVIGPIDMDHMAWLGDTVEQIAQEKVGIIKPGCTAIIGRQPHESEVMPIIEPIDMDHMAWLGDTVEQIAQEKVGIIKPGCTAIIGRQPHESEVMPIIEQAAAENHATLIRDGYEAEVVSRMPAVGGQMVTLRTPNGTYADVPVDKQAAAENHATLIRDGYEAEVVSRMPAVGGQMVTLRTPNGTYADVPVDKFGEHQAHNALAALCACEVVIRACPQWEARWSRCARRTAPTPTCRSTSSASIRRTTRSRHCARARW